MSRTIDRAWGEEYGWLTEKLAASSAARVADADQQGDPPEAALALALLEIAEECRAFIERYLPRVMAASDAAELDDALIELRDGLRHLVYHLKDAPFLREALD